MKETVDVTRSVRNIGDDLIRVISIIFVIMIHTGEKPWDGIPLLDAFITTIIFFSNSFFFMLSGKYNIGRRFESPNDYGLYFKKKFVDILFPYIIVSMLLSIWNLLLIPDLDMGTTPVVVYYLKFSLKELFSDNSSTHLWFMFCLMGFLVSAPFLSKMLNSMNDCELHILFGIGILWNTVSVFLFPFFYKPYSYNGWFLAGWIIHFCLGYYLDRIMKNDKHTWIYVAGGIGFIINVLGMTFASGRFHNPTDLTPSFILACSGAMAFLSKSIKINNVQFSRIIRFLAKHIFMIYMVHYNIVNYVTPLITDSLPTQIRYFSSVVITFLISLIIAVILNFVISPVKKIIRNAMGIGK